MWAGECVYLMASGCVLDSFFFLIPLLPSLVASSTYSTLPPSLFLSLSSLGISFSHLVLFTSICLLVTMLVWEFIRRILPQGSSLLTVEKHCIMCCMHVVIWVTIIWKTFVVKNIFVGQANHKKIKHTKFTYNRHFVCQIFVGCHNSKNFKWKFLH